MAGVRRSTGHGAGEDDPRKDQTDDHIQKVLDDKVEAFRFYLNTAKKFELDEATLEKLHRFAEV